MKMKLLTTTILLVVFMFSKLRLSAHNFVVWLTNGQRVYYSIDQQLRVIAENKMLVLQTLSERVEYSLSDVHKYTIEPKSDDSGIDSVKEQPAISQSPGCITLCGLSANADLIVYDISGRPVITLKADGSGTAVISTAGFASGVYILRTGNTSIKISKK